MKTFHTLLVLLGTASAWLLFAQAVPPLLLLTTDSSPKGHGKYSL